MNCFLIPNGYCSACQWFRRLKRPRLGTKKKIMAEILLKDPISPHKKAAHVALKPKNPFCILIVFRCSITLVLRLHRDERMRAVVAVMGMPRKESCWKNVWSPEVVAVSVRVIRSRVIWRAIW